MEEDKKKERNKRSNEWHKENYKRVPLNLSIEFYDWIKILSERSGTSVNSFIKGCIKYATENGYLGIYESYEAVYSDSIADEVEQIEKQIAKVMKEEDRPRKVSFDF